MARISFDAIKARVSIVDVLSRYFAPADLVLSEGKTQLRLPCPICLCDRRSFSASTVKNVFKCFGCGAQGNVLDLVAGLEEVDVPGAAKLLNEWFPVSDQQKKAKAKVLKPKVAKKEAAVAVDTQKESPKKASREASEIVPKMTNTVLGFELKGIEPDHADVAALGITRPAGFGIGYYQGRGTLAGQVVCPIRNEEGELLAYCGLAIADGVHCITYPGVQHFARDGDLYHPAWEQGVEDGGSLILVQSPLHAVLLCERGYHSAAFMALVPGVGQVRALYDFSIERGVRITYCYASADSDEHIGQVVRSLADIPLAVAVMM
ncbi:CHC2 zinc finger domain-containing protein [Granulosicoccus sp. 3-233]|uniref:CHC2 zinc finger domain-containing protein n=1 Tax=Granulosicoccus sp. 3-233 TaxID=3417969 RepID=UPI003D34F5CB